MKQLLIAALMALGAGGCSKPASAPTATALPALERPVHALRIAPAQRIVIPAAAWLERAGVPGVMVLNEQSQARFRMVRTGKRGDAGIEVLAGLKGDERLVLGDLRDVRDGSPIKTRRAD
jgi:hypothetical protein